MMFDIEHIFPTPVYRGKVACLDPDKMKPFVESQEFVQNSGNVSSLDKRILDHQGMASIKSEIQANLENYYIEILGASDSITPMICSSWLNVSQTGDSHHKHMHTNSLVSGVLYIRTNKDDSIMFYRDKNAVISFSGEDNAYTSHAVEMRVSECELLLFPSDLTHAVKPSSGNKTRVSLAFNSFPVGHLGCPEFANELVIRGG